MSFDLLAQIDLQAQFLAISGADVSLYARWRAARWADVQQSLLKSCQNSQVAQLIARDVAIIAAEISELIQSQQLNVAAEMIPDLVESLCSIAQGRYARFVQQSPLPPRLEDVVLGDHNNSGFAYALAA